MSKELRLTKGERSNFNTIIDAAKAGRLALMSCEDAQTGKKVATICAVNWVNGEVEFVPMARLFDGNPYDLLKPPVPDQEAPTAATHVG